MKATGIIRRIDDLGRIGIPKELRRNMRIREGDALELVSTDRGVLITKYVPQDEELQSAISAVMGILEDDINEIPESIKKDAVTLMQQIKKISRQEA